MERGHPLAVVHRRLLLSQAKVRMRRQAEENQEEHYSIVRLEHWDRHSGNRGDKRRMSGYL